MSVEVLKALPAPLSTRWTDRFALDFAMTLEGSGDKIEVLLEENKVTPDELIEFGKDPLFAQRVKAYQSQLRERGLSFRMKAQVQAEELLTTSWDLIHDRDASPAVRADLIKWTAKVAGFDTNKDVGAGDSGVKINIYMGDPALAPPPGVKVIDNG